MVNDIVIPCHTVSALCHADRMWSRKIICIISSNPDFTFLQYEERQAPGQGRALQMLSAKACRLTHRPEALYDAQQAHALLLRPSLSKRPVLMGSHSLKCVVEVARKQIA